MRKGVRDDAKFNVRNNARVNKRYYPPYYKESKLKSNVTWQTYFHASDKKPTTNKNLD